jgi:uncharacterized membrane protein
VVQMSAARESQLRSILKALTYRATGTVTTFLVTLSVTGELTVALAVGGIEPLVKIVVYYVHERAWQRVPAGTIRRVSRRTRARARLFIRQLNRPDS